MQKNRPVGWLSGAVVCGLSAVALGQTASAPNPQQMAAEIQSLKAQVAQLRADQGDHWLNQRRAEEVKTLVRQVLSDADTRASLASNGMTAGYNGQNFFLASDDDSFLMNISGQMQIRYIANFRSNDQPSPNVGSVENESGFEIRRAKVFFDGHIGDPRIIYKVAFVLDRKSDYFYAEDAWVGYKVTDGLTVTAGQFQDRFAREAWMSSKMSQTVDRSAVDNIFANNDNWVQGVALDWNATDFLHLGGSINDGIGSGGNPNVPGSSNSFNFNSDHVEYGLSGRADVKLAGDYKNESDVEAWSNIDGLQAFVGGGLHYEHAMPGNPGTVYAIPGGYDALTIWTADALLKYQGLGVMATGFGLYTNGATSAGSSSNYGATVQAGYMVIPDVLEPFARYEYIAPDHGIPGTNDIHIVTAGFNWFLHKHAAKFTLDAVCVLNNLNSASVLGTGLDGIGLLTDDPGKTDQVALRAQFQLLF